MQQWISWCPGALLLIVSTAGWAETVVLRSGYRLAVHSHHVRAGSVHLLMRNGGRIVVPKEAVIRVESDQSETNSGAEAEPHGTRSGGPDGLPGAIDRFAAQAGLPTDLVRAVIWAESDFQQAAVSRQGAIGLMQLMPETAAQLNVDPYDRDQNLQGGTTYLRRMLDRFEGHRDQLVKALAAYNAGPGQIDRHGGVPPFTETIAYVRRVVRRYLAASEEISRAVPGLDPQPDKQLGAALQPAY